ncbi:putative uncharacterized protein [Prevotella sp. CAG:255]|uniref:DUF4954 family protein n=1 Tax=Prevotella sp. CAG:255 TaxID=1262923 RepID=UPI00033694C3|nr:DUF4954 family protein [Prevotella sp. CAG:255]CCX69319.1 putative uncharacterized protein [Prevotella sp. CAG:255]
MDEYRLLTNEEINILEENGCTAEDWTNINVADDFQPTYIKNVNFYGEIFMGVFEKNIEVSNGFVRHSGIRNATLRNVSIGDNCLIENIGNYINNYAIGEECCICNVCTMETTAEATYGEGNTISVLNEAGNGNVILFSGLTSNLAALMIRNAADKEFTAAIRGIVRDDIERRAREKSTVGNNVKIVNTAEITNTHISDNCEINGASRISDCTLASGLEDNVFIGSGVICENSIVTDGSAVLNGANITNCFVGEACQITNGFTAESSLFFANCYMSNGEACAAFCGPFSASHHKSTLLIGCMLSFYNAGSATNFSNHAYKMGPIHYGCLERGTKTASGSHLLLPANIGAFSVCLGKITNHPDTRSLPFSYIISDGRETFVVPGINITTVGLYRDIRKWPRRDVRIQSSRKSLINHDWLSPLTINEIMAGKKTLEQMRESQGEDTAFYTCGGCKISRNSLERGIRLYDMAIKLFAGDVAAGYDLTAEGRDCGTGEWGDLAGMLLPEQEERNIVNAISNGYLRSTADIDMFMKNVNERYGEYLITFTRNIIASQLGTDDLTESGIEQIIQQGRAAKEAWISEIRKDAEKEYSMGDVEHAVLEKFITQLEEE